MDNLIDEIGTLEELRADIREYRGVDVEKGYRKTLSKIKRRSRKERLVSLFNKAAAVLVIPLLVSTLILTGRLVNKHDAPPPAEAIAFTEVTAVPGSVIKTALPDGSAVWLNSGTTLRYPMRFSGGKRAVELTGEAFFDVTTCPELPFEVATPSGLSVVATGTSFNVKAYGDDTVHEVILQEGEVDAVCLGEVIRLMPDEMALLDTGSGQMEKTIVNIEEKTGWKEGLLIFRNTPLEEVLKSLSRRHNVVFNIKNLRGINYRVHATFSIETLPQILNILRLAAPISWSAENVEQQQDLSFSRRQFNVEIK